VTGSSDKTELRTAMRALRRRLAAARPEAAGLVAGALPVDRLPAAAVYSLYHPVGSELDPSAIRLPRGRIALPVAVGRDAPLIFRLHVPGARLAPDAFGIPAPPEDAPEVAPDIVFTPVLAFDRRGGRLGQGAGCYDRTIANLRAVKPVLVIGVAYAGQEVAEAPMEAHDERLDAILTETGYIEVG
jgi:5-formyltetrahydrofolate cyclo-ligase